ncbi:hypothetical protein LINPERHAP1_LOCUS35193 [Linum perenne]
MNSPRIPVSSTAINSSSSIDSIQLSIQNLLKHWNTRQKYWNPFFRANQDQLQQLNTAPWRTKLATFLESMLLRIIVIILLLLDLFFTTLDLSSTILACHHDRRIPLVLAAEWFHWMEIGILSLLSVKLLALLVALGPTVFFRRPGYVIDGVVVVGALVLEGLLEGKGGGLVVVVSLWRVVRVVESAFELSDEAIEAMIEGIVLEFDALKAQNAMLMETIAERDEAIRMLQEMVEKLQGRY